MRPEAAKMVWTCTSHSAQPPSAICIYVHEYCHQSSLQNKNLQRYLVDIYSHADRDGALQLYVRAYQGRFSCAKGDTACRYEVDDRIKHGTRTYDRIRNKRFGGLVSRDASALRRPGRDHNMMAPIQEERGYREWFFGPQDVLP